jgi:hypothetical protein
MSSKLEELAKQFRIDNTKSNTYQNNESDKYGSTHPNALGDGDVKGKGTGNRLDTYNGGGLNDIQGVASEPDSGRIRNIKKNIYNADKPYQHPDTDGNEGQFTIGG